MITLHVVGVNAISSKIKTLPKTLTPELGKRIRAYASDPIMKESVEMCPKDSGALRSTNQVRRTKTTPSFIAVRLSYGGRTPGSSPHFVTGRKIKPVVEYAHRLHEHLYKSYSKPNTGPKYLEKAVMNHKDAIEKIIGSEVRQALLRVFSSARTPLSTLGV